MSKKKQPKKKWGKQLELFEGRWSAETAHYIAETAQKNQTTTWGGNAPNPLSMGDRNGSLIPGQDQDDRNGRLEQGKGLSMQANPHEYGALLDYIEWNEKHHKLN